MAAGGFLILSEGQLEIGRTDRSGSLREVEILILEDGSPDVSAHDQ